MNAGRKLSPTYPPVMVPAFLLIKLRANELFRAYVRRLQIAVDL
jgi:hypothetical protein